MVEIKFCSVCGSKVAESDKFCGSCGTKRVNLQKNDRIEITATAKSLNDFLQEKRIDRQKFNLPRKSLCYHITRSDAKPSHKIVETSALIEVEIMDMSKGNLEPVKGFRLPVKVGKDMNQQEICQLAIKKHGDHGQLFSNLEQYVLLYPDKILVYQVPGTTEIFTLTKCKTELTKPSSKLTLLALLQKTPKKHERFPAKD